MQKMDKYEFNIKVEQIKKLVKQGRRRDGNEDRRYHRLSPREKREPSDYGGSDLREK